MNNVWTTVNERMKVGKYSQTELFTVPNKKTRNSYDNQNTWFTVVYYLVLALYSVSHKSALIGNIIHYADQGILC